MKVLWPVAVITFKEGVRNRALYGIFILSLLMLGATLLVAGMIPQGIGKVAVDMTLSSISFSGLLLVLFVGINLLAKDLDRRTIYMVLSRPISRSQYIFGKFLGISLLIVVAVFFLSLFGATAIGLLKLIFPGYFARFSWPLISLAIVLIALMLILLSALSFLFSSFTTTSFVTFVLTVASYLVGHAISDIKELVESSSAVGIEVSPVTVKLVTFAYYVFPNLSLFDVKLQAAHALPVAPSYVFWVVLYCFIYTTIVVVLAALIFSRREFP